MPDQYVGVGKSMYHAGLAAITAGSTAAFIEDTSDAHPIWGRWGAQQRDLFVLDRWGRLVYSENLTPGFDGELLRRSILAALDATESQPQVHKQSAALGMRGSILTGCLWLQGEGRRGGEGGAERGAGGAGSCGWGGVGAGGRAEITTARASLSLPRCVQLAQRRRERRERGERGERERERERQTESDLR